MRYWIIIFTAFVFVSCNKSFYKHSNVPKEGKYCRKGEEHIVFLKIENNIAYIDFITRFKVPLYYYSDTVQLIETEERKWNGELVTLYENNRKLIIEAPTHDFYGNINREQTINSVIKLNEDYYDNSHNLYKNQTLFHKAETLLYPRNLESNIIYRELLRKHQMRKKSLELEYNDFLIEYEKFEQELIKELELLQ